MLGKYTDKAVEDLNDKAIRRSIITLPTLASFALFVPLVFIALYFGAPMIASAINALEGTVIIHILEVVGGGLAAIGIATTVYVIGRKDYLVFFFLAYFMSVSLKSLNITMVTYAVFGVLIALIFNMSKGKNTATVSANGTEVLNEDEYDDGQDDYEQRGEHHEEALDNLSVVDRQISDEFPRLSVHGEQVVLPVPFGVQHPYRQQGI